MKSYFKPSFFVRNRKAVQSRFPNQLIVMAAHGLLQRAHDSTYPFRQESNFWYLTGLNEPDIVLVIDGGDEYLIVPEHEEARIRFEGGVDIDAVKKRSGIKTVLTATVGWERLGDRLKITKEVVTLKAPPAYIEWHNFYTNPARANLLTRLTSISADIDIIDARNVMAELRVYKQPEEMHAMRAAIAITTQALTEIKSKISDFRYEYEVEAFLTYYFRNRGASHGFDPMVAFGENACTAHHMDNRTVITGKGLLLLDIGAEIEQYPADISRTYSVSEPTKRQEQVAKAVKDVYQYALSMMKPGITLKESEKLVEEFMGEKLRELELIKTLDREKIRAYYTHLTSHFLGLDVHDIGDYEMPLAPGMVLTVEPGIYIPEEKIGVRIEDDVLITETGCEVLSASLSRELR